MKTSPSVKKKCSNFTIKKVTASNERDGLASHTVNHIVGSTTDSWVPAWQGIWETNTHVGGATTRLNTGGILIGEWIQFEFNGPVSIEHFTVFGRDNVEAKWLPSTFNILGSNDGTEFTVLNSWTGIEMSQHSHATSLANYKTMTSPETTSIVEWRNDGNTGTGKNFFKKFNVLNTTKKRHVIYRISISKVTSGKALSISEFEFKHRTGEYIATTFKNFDVFRVPTVDVITFAE